MVREAELGRRRLSRWLVLGVAAVMVVTASCSSGGDGGGAGSAQADTPDPLAGPVAEISAELDPAGAPFMGTATGTSVPDGYEEHEFIASGTATDYKAEGEMGEDGRWTLKPDTSAEYATRVAVRYPSDPAKASGTVIVEWLNVSGGLDANPDYATLESEIVRQGHAWVGVSAQLIGVEGGPTLVGVPGTDSLVGRGLKNLNEERYGSLHHPGDGYSFDMFTQVARAVRSGALTGSATPEIVLAAGESQSAIALTTYYNGVQPITGEFDGFFVHSRANVGLPLVAPGEFADRTTIIETNARGDRFRDDLAAPVMNVQAESDLGEPLNSLLARQPDSPTFRLWEVAGTAHADRHMLGFVANLVKCGGPINNGPMYVVANAALSSLVGWVRDGTLPPEAPRLEVTGDATPVVARDGDGIALGGIRTAPVDVPVDVLSGAPTATWMTRT